MTIILLLVCFLRKRIVHRKIKYISSDSINNPTGTGIFQTHEKINKYTLVEP